MSVAVALRLPVYNCQGEEVGEVELNPEVFDVEPNIHLLHQVVVAYLANQRQGTHSTKRRGEVRGGGRKPWPQKYTGRARHGSIRSPIWVGGGVAHGPKPRDYTIDLPKKVKRKAFKMALTARFREGRIKVVERFDLPEIKTKRMVEILKNLELLNGEKEEPRILILTKGKDEVVWRSARNIPGVEVLPAEQVCTYDILVSDWLLMSLDALRYLQEERCTK